MQSQLAWRYHAGSAGQLESGNPDIVAAISCKTGTSSAGSKQSLDDTVRLPDENPPIGILLCKSKDRTIVEYALRESNKPIGVGTYQMVSDLPAEYAGQLPTPEQIAGLLADVPA